MAITDLFFRDTVGGFDQNIIRDSRDSTDGEFV